MGRSSSRKADGLRCYEPQMDALILPRHTDLDVPSELPDLPGPLLPADSADPKIGVIWDIGSAGVNIGVLTECVNALDARLRLDLGIGSLLETGVSSGSITATARALGLSAESQRNWVRQMPVEGLAKRPPGLRGLVRGISAGGLTAGAHVVRDFMRERLAESEREAFVATGRAVDYSTLVWGEIPRGKRVVVDNLGNPVTHRLQIGVQLGVQKGMQVHPFPADDWRSVVKRVARTAGIAVELNIARLRLPHVRQVSFPQTMADFGFDMTTELLADVIGASCARLPFILPPILVDPDSGRVYVAFDGASGVHRMVHPLQAMRDFNIMRFNDIVSGPGAQPNGPTLRVRIGQRFEKHGVTTYCDPEHGIPPMLTISLPPMFPATKWGLSAGEIEFSLAYGGMLADIIAKSRVVHTFIEQYPALREFWTRSCVDLAKAEAHQHRGSLGSVLAAVSHRVHDWPEGPPPPLSFRRSSLALEPHSFDEPLPTDQ